MKNKSNSLFRIISLSFVLAVAISLSATNVFAVTDTNDPPIVSEDGGTTVATVNIYNAKIESQKGNVFNISFDISNRVGIQSGVKYAVALKNSAGFSVDQRVYSEIIDLGENQTIHRNISYVAPTSLGGKYKLWMESRNSGGLPLAISMVGEVTLSASKTGTIGFLPETCYLTVRGENKQPRYTPLQGVDIASDEVLVATCKVKSTFTKTVAVFPLFSTTLRTIFGDVVEQTGGATSVISIPAGQSSVSIELPKAVKPQAYDVVVSLVSEDKSTTFSSTKFHYVLRGASGTIQNTVFDKLSYEAGETANLQIFWSISADTFEGSRIGQGTTVDATTLDILMVDGVTGSACGVAKNISVTANESVLNTPISVTKNCNNPTVKVSLAGVASGTTESLVLDSKEFQAPASTPDKATSSLFNSKNTPIIIVVILSILFLIMAVNFIRIKKNGNEN